jgi:phage/plasmid-like protein (TIGR03299 family)
MAHELDQTTGRAACFVAGEPAWHRLGTVVSEAQTSAEAIRLAALDWTVSKRPIYYHSPSDLPSDPLRSVADSFAIVRSDTGAALSVVGSFYRPFQNREAFDFMDAIVGERLAMFHTAGALKGGRKVWMLAKIPSELRIHGDDVVEPYVLLTNSHDGTSGLRILPTTVRVVCQNTLNLALSRAGASEGMSIVHTASLDQRIEEARAKLGIIRRQLETFQTAAQTMTRRSLTSEELANYFAGLLGNRAAKTQKKTIEAFADNFHNARNTLPGMRGSLWAAYNAVSEWADHDMRVVGKTTAEQLDNRVTSIWFGPANRIKQKAWEAALSLVA